MHSIPLATWLAVAVLIGGFVVGVALALVALVLWLLDRGSSGWAMASAVSFAAAFVAWLLQFFER